MLRGVGAPLEVGAFPVNAPPADGGNPRRLRERLLDEGGLVLPGRTNLEKLDAVPGDAVAEVDLGSNLRGGLRRFRKSNRARLQRSSSSSERATVTV